METYETMPQGDSAVCGRRVSFWMSRKKPKRHQGAAQDERSALIFAAPGPHYGGRPPERLCRVSGAQNLSDLPQFNPGPLGPCVCKNFRFSIQPPRLSLPSQRPRCVDSRSVSVDVAGFKSFPDYRFLPKSSKFRFRARSTGKMLPIRTSV